METKNTSKIGSTGPEIGDDDRISSLPDELITNILSFLDTKCAVGTSVLSRRWKDRWTRVSNLDLDNRNVYKSQEEAQELEPLPDIIRRRYLLFSGFVDKVLNEHKNLNSVTRFRFHIAHSVEHQYWTVLPELRFLRELVFGPLMEEIDVMFWEITSSGRARYVPCIPKNFYTLKNLRVAKLDGVALGAVEESASLPSLKILRLFEVEIYDFKSLGRLISGCPVLETLYLGSCVASYSDVEHIEVSAPSLKSLRIRDDDSMCFIVIEAPKLEVLYLEQFTKLMFKGCRTLSCLHSAHVYAGVEGRSSYHNLFGLLTQVSNAKKIHVSGYLRHLPSVGFKLPVFPNLTHLTIGIGHNSWALYSFLKSASKLQSLVIDMKQENDMGQPTEWKGLETACVPDCLLSSLEEIEIKDLVVCQSEMKMIAFLLNAGVVLKKVSMHLTGRFKMMAGKDLVSLLELARISSTCKVELFFPEEEYICNDGDDEGDGDDNIDNDDETDNIDDEMDEDDANNN